MQIKFDETMYMTMYHNTTEYTPCHMYNMNVSKSLIKVRWLLRNNWKKMLLRFIDEYLHKCDK